MSPEAHLIRSAEVGLEARLQSSPFLNQPPIFTPLPARLTCLKEALKQDNRKKVKLAFPYLFRGLRTRLENALTLTKLFTFYFSSIFRSLLPLPSL